LIREIDYYLARLRELPRGTILKKAVMKPLERAAVKLKGLIARLSLQDITEEELLESHEGLANVEDVLHAIRGERPPFFIKPSERTKLISLIKKEFPQLEAEILVEADKVCSHIFDLLGSGPVNLDEFSEQHGGREACGYLPWHFDFKTGYRWNPKKYYKEIRPAYGKADIKVPWELSRFQHAALLGQSYWLTGDEKYALEFVRQVDDWIDLNQPKFGVNWACTMDVAIRVANWILGFYFFKDSKAFTDEFLIKFLKSLLIHGRQIISNLENRGITTNHYLSDLVGLIYLGIAFPEFKEARQWREFGIKELVNEMDKQVYDDGMDFEASTCYHRLALELFFYPAVLCQLNGIELPQTFLDKLKKMFDFVLYVLKPNGRMPQIGDNDNGRLHVLGKREILNMTYILTYAALYFNDPIYKIEEFGFSPEAIWLFGSNAYESWNRLPGRSVEDLESRVFHDGGIYVMRHKKDYMVISCGPNGQGGCGGHAHNDKLSFELCVDGEDIIVDPGSFLYTSHPRWRNIFRATTYHNTCSIDQLEQNTIYKEDLFMLPNKTRERCTKWKVSTNIIKFIGEQRGFMKNMKAITHKREIVYNKTKSYWSLEDNFYLSNNEQSKRPFKIKWFFNIYPSVNVLAKTGEINFNSKKSKIQLKFPNTLSCVINNKYYSKEYGFKEKSNQILFNITSFLPFCAKFYIYKLHNLCE